MPIQINPIVWVKKGATNRPNDQRAEILNLSKEGRIIKLRVRMCGDNEEMVIEPTDVCGVEFKSVDNQIDLDLFFKVGQSKYTELTTYGG